MDKLQLSSDYVNVGEFLHVQIDLRYASCNNFTGENLYGECLRQAYLHHHAAEKFRRAVDGLKREKPDWSFLILDALRPLSVQKRMWTFVENTPQQIYVANPQRGSIHNFGLAIDLTLMDESGREVDMGTTFDCFEDLAQPRFEEKFLQAGQLTQGQVQNRHLLRRLMAGAGFLAIPHEWWHFNAVEIAEARANYVMIE